jgi:(2Fe-2S) ferredoxin
MTMQKPTHHILVCASFRVKGESQGMCHKKDAAALLPYIESELGDRGMDDVMISSTGCLNRCENGPLMVVYPEGSWYGAVNEEKIDEILDAMQEGKPAEGLLLA